MSKKFVVKDDVEELHVDCTDVFVDQRELTKQDQYFEGLAKELGTTKERQMALRAFTTDLVRKLPAS